MPQVEVLKNVITADIRGLKQGFQAADQQTTKLTKRFKNFSGALKGIFATGAFVFGIKASIDFRKQMALTGTLIAGERKKLEEYARTAQDFSIRFNQTTEKMAEGAFMVQSAFADADDITKKWATTTRAATAGNTDVATSLKGLSSWVKGFGDTSDEAFSKAADLIFQINKLGQTTFQDLAASMGRTIPVAAAMGVQQEELAAVFATLTGVTGDAAEVSTQAAGIMRAFIKPTTGMKEALKGLGFETAEQIIKQRGLIGAMRDLYNSTDRSSVSVGKLFRRTEAMTALFALTGGQAETFDEKLKAMHNSAGAADAAFKEISEGINKTGFEMEQVGKAFTVFVQRTFDSVTQTDEFSASMRTLRDILSSSEFQGAISWLLKRLVDMVAALPRLWIGIGELVKQSQDLKAQTRDQAEEYERLEKRLENFVKTTQATREEYGDLMDAIIMTDQGTEDLADRTANLIKVMQDIRKGKFGENIAKQFRVWNAEQRKNIKVFGGQKAIIKKVDAELNNYFGTIDSATTKTKDFGTKIKSTGTDAEKTAQKIKDFGAAIELMNEMTTENVDIDKEMKSSLMGIQKVLSSGIKKSLDMAEAQEEQAGATETAAEAFKRQSREADAAGQKIAGVANEFANLAGNVAVFAGMSQKAIKGFEAIVQGFGEMMSGNMLQGMSTLVSNLENIGELFLGSGNDAGAAAAEFEKWADAARELGEELGVLITDEMSTRLSNYFQAVQDGTAAMGNFVGWLREANEVVGESISGWTGFGMATFELGENLEAYNDAAEQAAALTKEFVTDKTLQSVEALNDLLAVEPVRNLRKEIKELQSDLASTTDRKEIAAIEKELIERQEELQKLIPQTQEQFENQARMAMVTFNELLRGGMSTTDALLNMGDTFDFLNESAKDLGFTGSEVFEDFAKWRELIEQNQDLINMAQGLNAQFDLMKQTRAFDPVIQGAEKAAENFDAFGDSAIDIFNKLLEAGFSEQQALDALAPVLNGLEDQMEKFGLEASDDLMKLIELAPEIDENPMIEALGEIANILTAIAERLGATFEDISEKAGESIRSNMGGAIGDLDNLRMPPLDTFGLAGLDGAAGVPGGGISGTQEIRTTNIESGAINLNMPIESAMSAKELTALIEDNAGQIADIISEKLEGI